MNTALPVESLQDSVQKLVKCNEEISSISSKLASIEEEKSKAVNDLEHLRTEMSSVKQLLAQMLDVSPKEAKSKPKSAPATRKPTVKAQVPATAPAGPETSEKKVSLKSIVLDLLKKRPEGMELRDITESVTNMVKNKQYHTSAKSINAVVSQAAVHLAKDHEIIAERDEHTKRRRYRMRKTKGD